MYARAHVDGGPRVSRYCTVGV